jgi:polyisoprenyl-phosphate glycosyltransferase
MPTAPRATLAVVIPIYDEEHNLAQLRERLTRACERLEGVDWRVLYVDDGSRDRSREMLLRQHAEDPRFGLIELSRNFGHQSAITAGLAHADADAVVLMDGDLQDPPEVVPELVAAWRAGGQVVLAVRRSRAERGLRGLLLAGFHRLFQWVSDFPIARDTGIFCLLDRRAQDALRSLGESHRFLPGLQSWIGFERRTVEYDRGARAAGEPKQSYRRLVRYALDAVFGFSYMPLRLMTISGLFVSAFGFLLAAFFIVRRLLGIEIAQIGFTTLITMVLFLGGLQLIAIGLLGEYLGRIYDEVKGRPLYIVSRRHGVPPPPGAGA